MPEIAIVTDSSACLPADLLASHGIRIVPLTFLFDGDIHYDGTLSATEFYKLLRSAKKFPTTASPAPGAFLETFREATRSAESALCITLPSRFSGTYSSALNAVELARQELPDFTIRVVDSHCLAMCHGFAVLSAARAIQQGANLDEAEAVVKEVCRRSYLIGVLDTMRYMAKSGRVPMVLHWATSALKIKPILAARGEDINGIARVRTMPRALDRLLSEIQKRVGDERPLHMAVMQADAQETAEQLADTIRQRFNPEELLVTEFTSVMGAHTGPGFVGVAFFAGEPSANGAKAPANKEESPNSSLEEDMRRLESTLGEPPPPQSRPALVMVSGLPGTGKSRFSRELARSYPLIHLNSDSLRKALFPRPTHSADESGRLFAAIHALIERLLARKLSVLLDATSLKEMYRRPVYEIAERAGAALVIVQTEAPPDVVRQRLAARPHGDDPEDTSEATIYVYDRMRREAEPIERPHIRVDTSGDIEQALRQVIGELESVREGLAG